MRSIVLVTGEPRVGKTSALREIIERVGSEQCGGFYTEEIRRHDERVGFQLVSLDGESRTFAHLDFPSPLRIGRYGLDLAGLDTIGVPAVYQALGHKKLLMIDELGLMQASSQLFRQAITAAFIQASFLVATISLHPHPWLDTLKKHEGVHVYHLTPENRLLIIEHITRLVSRHYPEGEIL